MAQAVHRKILLTTLLSGSVMLSSYAHAQDDGTYFYPKNKWTVEQVGTDGDLPICSISNQLNNGYIVQLAGTKDSLSNLNIDFRQNAFQKNMKYEVQYTIPGQGSTIIPTKAFKDSLLVSDLRKNSEFSNKLFDASTMDVNIRGNKFRVYLTGLKASMGGYNDCIDPGGLLASAEKTIQQNEKILSSEPIPPKGSAPLPPINLNEVQQAEAQSPSELTQNQKRPDFESRERYSDELASQLKEESQKYKPDAQSAPEIYNAADDSAQDEQPITATIEDMPTQETTSEDKYSSAINDVKKTVDRKDAIYHINKPSKPLIADLTQLDKEAQDTDAAAEESIELNAAAEAVTQTPNSAANLENKYEPASGDSDEDFVIMRNKISDLEKQLETVLSNNQMLNDELKIALVDSQKEQMTVSSENWNLEKATMKFNEAERQIMRLGRQLQSTRAQCDQEKQKLESMLFDPKLTNQQQLASLASLEAELDETKSDLYRQQRQYEERIKLLEQRLNAQ